MELFRMKAALAALAAVSVLFVAHASEAAGETWYTQMNCQPDSPTANTSWGLNQYGYYNTDTTNSLALHCSQPRISTNIGYNQSYASGYNRSSTGTTVKLCQNTADGTGYVCTQQSTTTIGSFTLTFSQTLGNLYNYRFWEVTLPPYDAINGSSHLTALNYNDS